MKMMTTSIRISIGGFPIMLNRDPTNLTTVAVWRGDRNDSTRWEMLKFIDTQNTYHMSEEHLRELIACCTNKMHNSPSITLNLIERFRQKLQQLINNNFMDA